MLLGSKGGGKTTIVKILTTLIEQDSGTAAANGFDVASKPDSVRQSISLTGQFATVDEILTGWEHLNMVTRLRHLKNPRQVADDLLNRLGLTDAADRAVSTYSGVMRRRLDIPMSLMRKPPQSRILVSGNMAVSVNHESMSSPLNPLSSAWRGDFPEPS